MARKILLADDSVTAQNMGRKILSDAGYDVVTVNNGSAALKRVADMKPDLIVLDVYMPGYSGLEVCQRLKDSQDTARIPVLLTVGKLEPFKPEEARRVNADGYIIKPFEASELLSALTRMEGRLVPAHPDGSRFSASVSGLERFENDSPARKPESTETDTGWKSRLRFPARKKKEEPEPEPEPDFTTAPSFREYRRGKGKAPAASSQKPSSTSQEPGLVPDIPRDITPEELDALSAFAAKLDGHTPRPENIASLAEKIGPSDPASAHVGTAALGCPAGQSPAAPAETKTAIEFPVVQVEQREPEPAATNAAAVEPAPAPAAAEPAPAVIDAQYPETPESRIPEPQPVENVALFAEQPAPVDRSDEPMFDSAPSVAEQASSQAKEEVEQPAPSPVQPDTELKTSLSDGIQPPEKSREAAPESSSPREPRREDGSDRAPEGRTTSSHTDVEATGSADTPVRDSLPIDSGTTTIQAKAEEAPKAEPIKSEEIAQPVAAAPQDTAPAEDSAPSDEELAEALRLLTPALGHTDLSSIPSQETLVVAGALLAEQAARSAAATRWVAQSVAVTPEEAALSLEAEMFGTFSAAPAQGGDAAPAPAEASAEVIATMAASAQPYGADIPVRVSSPEPLQVDQNAPEQSKVEPIKAEQQEPPINPPAEEAPAEVAAAVTSADAVHRDEPEDGSTKESAEPVSSAAAPAAESALPVAGSIEVSTSETAAGGEESMGKDAKSGKSNWHQIRTASAPAAAQRDAVEAAKQPETAADEPPKAMAAAAAAESAPAAPATTPDSSTIASIVDSVLADLRPRIVEEIARKLAKKD